VNARWHVVDHLAVDGLKELSGVVPPVHSDATLAIRYARSLAGRTFPG
jgi:hypothetical protein